MSASGQSVSYPEHYFPGAEELRPDEMRITALGTGRPFLRRSQANACWLIELGNGDKFVFDFGFGSQMNFTALEIPYGDITAWFATHLHTDHVGDFGQVWVGSWTGGRLKPLEVYGPSGPETKYGFKHFCEKQMESYAWDTDTRVGALPAVGAEVNVHEFNYAETGPVYQHNGVTISSFPAVHQFDGPVSLRLDWNGLSFVYSGDTTPSRFFIDNAQNADVVVHETFNTVEQLMEKSGYDERSARAIGTFVHSAPEEAAVVLRVGFESHASRANLRTRSMTEAAYRQARAGAMVASKSFVSRRLRLRLCCFRVVGVHMAAPDRSQKPSWNHINTGHSTTFETASKGGGPEACRGVSFPK